MSLTVQSLADSADPEQSLATYHRIDDAAFGGPPDPASAGAKRPLVHLDRWYLAELDGEPCGGVGSFPFELTLPGGATVPAAGVSDVGVLPTHRRRGVLSALMDRQLGDLAHRGEVAAVLHASEASIYRRFGYGPATRWRQIRVETRRSAFADHWPRPAGSYRVVPRQDAVEACAAVHDLARRQHAGGLSRSEDWWRVVLGDTELYLGGGSRRLVILHLDGAGAPDGYVIYEIDEDWSSGQAGHRLRVWELVGTSVPVELGLWRTVLDHDLVAQVTAPIAVDHVLWEAMSDPRQVRTMWDQDLLWTRLLDVPAALAARTYGAADSLVLGVQEGRGVAAAAYRLSWDGTAAECGPVDAAPDLVLTLADLGSVWLGGGSLRRMALAGRVHEVRPGAAATADAMFSTDPAPWCWVRF